MTNILPQIHWQTRQIKYKLHPHCSSIYCVWYGTKNLQLENVQLKQLVL